MSDYEDYYTDEEENVEYGEEDLYYLEHVDKYKLYEILSHKPSKEYISQRFLQDYSHSLGLEIREYCNNVLRYSRKFTSTIFKNDSSNILGELDAIIYNNIEKKYTKQIYTEMPVLIKPFISYMEEIEKNKKPEKKVYNVNNKLHIWNTVDVETIDKNNKPKTLMEIMKEQEIVKKEKDKRISEMKQERLKRELIEIQNKNKYVAPPPDETTKVFNKDVEETPVVVKKSRFSNLISVNNTNTNNNQIKKQTNNTFQSAFISNIGNKSPTSPRVNIFTKK